MWRGRHRMTLLRNFKFLELLVLLLLLGSESAWGQACCAGGSALTPGRLALHEEAAVGISIRLTDFTSSFDAARAVVPASPGATDVELEEDVLGTLRVLERGQVTVLVPVVETFRHVPGLSNAGGGLGDVNLAGRYDVLSARESAWAPGIAALLGVTVPSGRTPESAHGALAADATGIGAFQLNAGLALEQTFGHVLINLTGIVSQRTARSVQGLSELLGPQLLALAGGGYAFENDAAVAASFTYTVETDASIGGVRAPGSGRALSALGVSGSLPLGELWRLQGGAFFDVPARGFGRNQPAGPGVTLTLLRTWI